jgi:ABC-2 type transport system permease protein
MSTRELGAGRAITLVASREIRSRLGSRAYRLTTLFFVLAVIAGGVVLHLVSGNQSSVTVGLTPAAATTAGQLTSTAKASGVMLTPKNVADAAAGETAVRDGSLDIVITATSPALTVIVKDSVGQSMQPVLASLAQQLALSDEVRSLGGDPQQAAARIASAVPQVTALEPPPEVDGGQIAAGYIAGILLFLALMTSGQLVAQGVVEEKSSRVVELLLATLRPWQLMAGKVLGIGTVGLGQVLLVVGAGLGTATALGLVDGSSVNLGAAAGWALMWFVVGFASYALVLAALASLVSRQEDVGSVIGPVTALMVVPYVIAISIAPWSPDSPLVTWLSYIPFCSPMVMPVRIALGTVSTWEALLSMAISLALVPLLVWLAGRIYSTAVVHSGGKMRLRDALRG